MLDPTLATTVAEKLKARQQTIGVAEGSCGGLVSAALLAIPGASSMAQVESNAAAADIALAADEYGALTAAAEAFHPSTGVSAIPALVRARRT